MYPNQICFINEHFFSTGYLYKFDVYCGKSLDGNDDERETSANNTNVYEV